MIKHQDSYNFLLGSKWCLLKWWTPTYCHQVCSKIQSRLYLEHTKPQAGGEQIVRNCVYVKEICSLQGKMLTQILIPRMDILYIHDWERHEADVILFSDDPMKDLPGRPHTAPIARSNVMSSECTCEWPQTQINPLKDFCKVARWYKSYSIHRNN